MLSRVAGVSPAGLGPVPEAAPRRAENFKGLLLEAIERVEGLRRDADESVLRLLAGENEEVHQSVLAVQRAELAFQLFVEVRNKLVEAYQEIMRMPI